MGCLFCDIIAGKIPSKKVYENDHVFCFEDINPQSPVHALIIPKKHLARLEECTPDDRQLLGELFMAANEIARIKNLAAGYRVIINNGAAGGQVIWHLHMHILGGRDDMGPMVVK